MWPWLKRWRDWAMHDLWSMQRMNTQPQALHFSYEKAGLTLADAAIPWNAEAVLVEASLRLPAAARRKGDFQLRLLETNMIYNADSLRRDDSEDRYLLFFRLPTPPRSATAQLLWREHPLGQLTLPIVQREEFLQNLRLQMPTLFVRLGEHSVACQTFVSTQCRGLIATALLASPISLAPLLDLGFQVEFRSERTGVVSTVPAQLCSSQLAGKQALFTVIPHKVPRRIGTWVATWMVAGQPLASQRIRAISLRHFHRSLRISDTRFVIQTSKDGMHLRRQIPQLAPGDRVGPCFLVSSGELGMAGLCPFQVRAQVPGAIREPLLLEQEVLITDGPTAVAPGTLDAAELSQVTAFELRLKGTSLGILSMCPTPSATFTSEGGFKPPEHFLWSAGAEEELNDRLSRLLEGDG
ncbi:MAG: hypothetical protein ACK4RK_05915 [Gemmataceae bacterium]